MWPAGPGVIIHGARSAVRPSVYSVTLPPVVMRPVRPGAGEQAHQSDRAVAGGAARLVEPECAVGAVSDAGRPRVRREVGAAFAGAGHEDLEDALGRDA